MQSFPSTPPLSGADLTGHLWLDEHVAGAPVRFRVAASGLVTFGDARRTFDEEVPLPLRAAARHVRANVDREALRAAADGTPGRITFFGVATRLETVDYDWERLPAFLGVDVWSDERGAYLPPDVTERAFDRLGLAPVNAIEREVPAAHVDLAAYDLPASNWYDGPAAGVLVRDKTGGRALIENDDLPARPDPVDAPPADLAARYATADRIERVAARLEEEGAAPTVEAVLDRLLEAVAREAYARLYRDDEPVVDVRAFRSALAERVQRHLGA